MVKAYVPTDEQRASLLEELVAVATGGWKAPWLTGIALLCKADGIVIHTNETRLSSLDIWAARLWGIAAAAAETREGHPRTTALFDEYRRRIPALDRQLIQGRYG